MSRRPGVPRLAATTGRTARARRTCGVSSPSRGLQPARSGRPRHPPGASRRRPTRLRSCPAPGAPSRRVRRATTTLGPGAGVRHSGQFHDAAPVRRLGTLGGDRRTCTPGSPQRGHERRSASRTRPDVRYPALRWTAHGARRHTRWPRVSGTATAGADLASRRPGGPTPAGRQRAPAKSYWASPAYSWR